MSADREGDAAEEELSSLCADLLAEKKNLAFMVRLFSEPPGAWRALETLVRGIPGIEDAFEALAATFSYPTRVTWLEYREYAGGAGFCTVIFFNEGGWSRVWIYNRTLVEAPND